MAKQKKLNKNLVAVLTLAGIGLTVGLVAIVTSQSAKRDPEVLAANARQREEDKDLERAVVLYQQAYQASPNQDVKYLIAAARCLFTTGDFRAWLNVLQAANSQEPANVDVLTALLDGLWKLRIVGGETNATSLRDYGAKLIEVQPNNVNGLVSKAVALIDLRTPDGRDDAEIVKVLDAAVKASPTDTRVALAQIVWERTLVAQRMAEARERPTAGTEVPQIVDAFAQRAETILKTALAAHPGDHELVGAYLRLLADRDRDDEGRAVLESALAQKKESPELHAEMARYLRVQLTRKRDQLDDAAREALRQEGIRHADEAVKLDPAAYDAYVTRAQFELQPAPGATAATALRPEQYEAALKIYRDATNATRTLRSFRAIIMKPVRVQMLAQGFRTALGHFSTAADDETRKARLEQAKFFLDDAETKYSDFPLTHYMRGLFAVASNEPRDAILAFEKAYKRKFPAGFYYQNFNSIVTEQLAELYAGAQQVGEAVRYAEEAVREYSAILGPDEVPFNVQCRYAELLNDTGRSKEALVIAERLLQKNPVDLRLRSIQATATARIPGRGNETRDIISNLSASDAEKLFSNAKLAMAQRNFDEALAALNALFALADETDETRRASDGELRAALAIYVPLMIQRDERDAGLAIVRKLKGRMPADKYGRLLAAYEVMLSERDEKKVEERLAAVIDDPTTNPDENARLSELYSFYQSRNLLDKAAECLDRIEKLRPNDRDVLIQQFYMALQRAGEKEGGDAFVARAAGYVDRLVALNADGAHGATYRGEIAMIRGNTEDAIRELRTAQRELPRDSELDVKMALAYLAANRRNEALEALNSAIEANPRSYRANKLMFYTCDALARQATGDEQRKYKQLAEKHLEIAGRLPAAATDTEFQQRRDEIREAQDPVAAVREREQRRRERPDDLENILRLGELYGRIAIDKKSAGGEDFQRLGDLAHQSFTAALAAQPGRTDIITKAIEFYGGAGRRQDGEAALKTYTDARSGTDKVAALMLSARFYERLGDKAAAEQRLAEVRAAVPTLIEKKEDQRSADLQIAFETIEFYNRTGNRKSVIEACRALGPKLDPKIAAERQALQLTRIYLIDALLRDAQLGDAEKEADAFVREFPEDPRGLITRAGVLLARNDRQKAGADLNEIIRQNPDNIWALYNRGNLALQSGDVVAAKEDFLKAKAGVAREKSLEIPLRSRLAVLYEVSRDYEQAENELRELLDVVVKDESSGPQAQAQVVDRLVRLYDATNRPERAQRLLSELIEKDADRAEWPLQLAGVIERRAAATALDERRTAAERLAESRKDYAAAASYYQRAQEKSAAAATPAQRRVNEMSTSARIYCLARADRAADAVALFEAIPAAQISPMIRTSAVAAYSAAAAPAKAAEQARQALLESSRASLAAVSSIAGRLRTHLATADVVEMLRALAEGAPGEAIEGVRLRVVLAGNMLLAGSPKEALPVLEGVIARLKPEQQPEYPECVMLQAQALQLTGKSTEATQLYAKILERDTNNVTALNNLAYLLATDENRPQEALKYADKLYSLIGGQSDAADALDTIGWVYFKNDRLEPAAARLAEAIAADPDNAAIYEHLGQVLQKLGRNADAREKFDQGLRRARAKGDTETARRLEAALKQ